MTELTDSDFRTAPQADQPQYPAAVITKAPATTRGMFLYTRTFTDADRHLHLEQTIRRFLDSGQGPAVQLVNCHTRPDTDSDLPGEIVSFTVMGDQLQLTQFHHTFDAYYETHLLTATDQTPTM